MATINKPSAISDAAEKVARRRQRLADQIGNRLYTAALYDHPIRTGQLGEMHPLLSYEPALRDLLHQAPRVAASNPLAVRAVRSARDTLLVLRIHGRDWSLVMTGGRPLPTHLLGLHDEYRPEDGPLSLLDPQWRAEIAAMCRAIDEALAARTVHMDIPQRPRGKPLRE